MSHGNLSEDSYRRPVLRNIEDEILRQTENAVEFFLLLDERADPLYAKLGRRNVIGDRVLHAVALRRSEMRPYVSKGYLFTHNHPSRSSFTPEDVIAMSFLGVREGNAFDTERRYRLLRVGSVWPEEGALLQELAVLETEVMAFQAAALRSGRITPAEAAVAHYHLVWTLFAQRHVGEFVYEREAR
jgi:hypothetical protein